MNKKTSLNIGLGVNNVFDTSYRNYLNSLRYFADEIGRNFSIQLIIPIGFNVADISTNIH